MECVPIRAWRKAAFISSFQVPAVPSSRAQPIGRCALARRIAPAHIARNFAAHRQRMWTALERSAQRSTRDRPRPRTPIAAITNSNAQAN
jgi:hypothetical protein